MVVALPLNEIEYSCYYVVWLLWVADRFSSSCVQSVYFKKLEWALLWGKIHLNNNKYYNNYFPNREYRGFLHCPALRQFFCKNEFHGKTHLFTNVIRKHKKIKNRVLFSITITHSPPTFQNSMKKNIYIYQTSVIPSFHHPICTATKRPCRRQKTSAENNKKIYSTDAMWLE